MNPGTGESAVAALSGASTPQNGGAQEVNDSDPLKSASRMTGLSQSWMVSGVVFFLLAATWLVFGQTVHYGFLNWDDNTYVYENSIVQQGLTIGGLRWALTTVQASNWHPLTWYSHMFDCQLYGLKAGGHHFTNVLLHAATAILLFLVLRQLTGFLWRSAFVAAIFAIHPLHVESVAWIAERKDVLSGLFFTLTLAAYVRYVRHPWSVGRYLWVAFMLALALMAKPMVVTLPFVLLLLDYWPLKRFNQPAGGLIPRRLILEKIPLLTLSGAVCVITIFAQQEAISALPLPERLGNALIACVVYLGQMIYPVGLAPFYPYRESSLTPVKVIAALVLLLGISVVAFVTRRQHPWLLFGWLWYLIMLLPVIGILQAGLQAHADRYTYLPQIGLYVALTWAAAEWCARGRGRRLWLAGGSTVILAVLIFSAHAQTAGWRNSETLWTHALACTPDNSTAEIHLGDALLHEDRADEAITRFQRALQLNPDDAKAQVSFGYALIQQGRLDEALLHFQQALEIKPDDAEAHNNLGDILAQKGRVDEALTEFQLALQTKPDYAEAHYNLANALVQKQQADEALVQYQMALQIRPDYAAACYNLGNTLFQKGRLDEAIARYQQALRIQPGYANARYNLGVALVQRGKVEEAIAQFQQALQTRPDFPQAQNELAWELATSARAAVRNGIQAVELAERANQLTRGANPVIIRTLAAAYAEAGRFDDAVWTARKAIASAQATGQSDQMLQLDAELRLYEAGLPFHQPGN